MVLAKAPFCRLQLQSTELLKRRTNYMRPSSSQIRRLRIEDAQIRFSYREGAQSQTRNIRKPSTRWRGNSERPLRPVRYVDLSRIQPVGARVGYLKLLKGGVTEGEHTAFDAARLGRYSHVMGKRYGAAGISTTSLDNRRTVPVISFDNHRYSGFHQGAGELAAAELLAFDLPNYSLVLIDELETSLHPRAQRRLVDDLVRLARVNELQILITTHSPYILEQLPPQGRMYIMDGVQGKIASSGRSARSSRSLGC
ncbi:MAG TPA: AAA family ATPase [Candidatus Xenobia bacterium]|jgi:hypothetical protein